MSMSNLLLVLMFSFWMIPSLIYQQYFLTLGFIIYGLVFGFVEFLSDYALDFTVSQQLTGLGVDHPEKMKTVIGFLILGWLCLMLHFGVKVKTPTELFWLLVKSSLWTFVLMKFVWKM